MAVSIAVTLVCDSRRVAGCQWRYDLGANPVRAAVAARWRQAAEMDVVLVGDLGDDETTVWCARRLLKEMLLDVAWARGLLLDPDTSSLDAQPLKIRSRIALPG